MKILELQIEGYKNLKDVKFDFSNCDNYIALIGINASGKSNVLEAISQIFYNVYYKEKTSFNYFIAYQIDENLIEIKNDVLTVNKETIKKDDYNNYLPSSLIASYSGEELRMWDDIYLKSYSSYFNALKKHKNLFPFLIYINKFAWDIALITLLSSEKPIVKKFIRETLKIDDENIEIEFDIDEDKYKFYEDNKALSLVKRIAGFMSTSSTGKVHINVIKTMDLEHQNNDDFTKKLFYYLYTTSMPKESKDLKIDKIIKKITFNDIDIKGLSEGEKKLILIMLINEILSDKNSIVLLDEPDAHLHIERKKQIKNLIQDNNAFTILTTHSPTLLNVLDEKNIFILSSKNETGVIVIPANKQRDLKELTGGAFSLMDATIVAATEKDILLVEGTNDYNYLIEALYRFKDDYLNFNYLIINCGGAGNVAAVLEQSVLPILGKNQLCVCTFDEDKPGKDGKKKVENLMEETKYIDKKDNVKAITHPRFDGFQGDTFFMEDYFNPKVYETLSNNERGFAKYGIIKSLKREIEKKYKTYADSDYENFKVILNELIKIQTDFHKK